MRDIVIDAFTHGATTWATLLIGAAVKGVVLLAVAGGITLVLRRASAATRHYVWTVAVGALVLLPALALVAPRWNSTFLAASIPPSLVPPSVTRPSTLESGKRPDAGVGVVPSAATPNAPPKDTPLASPRQEITPSADRASALSATAAAHSAQAAGMSVRAENSSARAAEWSSRTATVSSRQSAVSSAGAAAATHVSTEEALPAVQWWMILSIVWAAGALVLIARLLIGQWVTSRLARRAEIVEDAGWISLTNRLARQLGITRPVTLVRSHQAGVPMTWGVFYPVILLPEDADTWTADRRSIVLLHELAHVHRLDALTQTIAQLATTLFWINPLVWLAARQMRTERERACDDFVLAAGMRPSVYASDLLEIVQSMGSEPRLAYAALAMARRTEFEGRLLAILDPATPRSRMSGVMKFSCAVLALMLLVPLAGMRPASQRADAVASRQTEPLKAVMQASAMDSVRVEAPAPDSSRMRLSILDTLRKRFEPIAGMPSRATDVALTDVEEPNVAVPSVDSADTVSAPRPVLGVTIAGNDKETLILIVRAAARMQSDHEKSSLLIEILDRFIGDDSLRLAFLATTATIKGDHDRQRVLDSLLSRDPLSDASRVVFLKTASGLSGDHSRRVILSRFVAKHELTNAAVRQAFFDAVKAMSSGYDQQMVFVAAVKRAPKLTRGEALSILTSVKGMSSSSNKAAVLIAVAEKIGLTDDEVRKAYIDAAGTLSSDGDYRRVMSAAIKSAPKYQ